MDDELIDAVAHHIEQYIGPIDKVLHELIPTSDLHIDIHIVKPSKSRPFYTLVTSGMSELPMTLPQGVSEEELSPYAELLICLPADWRLDKLGEERFNWPVHWMRILATYPHENQTLIHLGHTIPNGEEAEPFGPNTKLGCWFLRDCETVAAAHRTFGYDGRQVQLLGMTAIYRSEMEFALQNDMEMLEELDQRLTRAGASELLDLTRKPVA